MTLEQAREWMLSNPGKKITCEYFHNDWIMFDGSRFVFENGSEADSEWWQWMYAHEFKSEWYEMKEETKSHNQVNEMNNIQVPSPCDKCPNNKKNNPNASGICFCALPYFANPIR